MKGDDNKNAQQQSLNERDNVTRTGFKIAPK
jgi:hypothetical protein